VPLWEDLRLKEEQKMTLAVKLWLALLLVVGGVSVGTVAFNAAISPDNWMYQGGAQWKDIGPHAAPGPVIGAGLPVLLLIGGGYWVARRFRRKPE
jgi:hypothetical protein